MGRSKKHIPNRKTKLQKLTRLCLKHFGKDFDHWSWEIDSGCVYEGRPSKYAAAIELPKEDINGNSCYTDPFIGKSGGSSKSLETACENATNWIEWKFEGYL